MKRVLSLILATALLLTGIIQTAIPVFAASKEENAKYYFGSRLTDEVEIEFYNILADMDFAKGESKTVSGDKISEEAAAYASGDVTLMKHFGAAIDSFSYDHMEYFYIDYDLITLNVKLINGKYEVSVGSGRTDTYLRDKTADIPSQVEAYNTALENLVAGAQKSSIRATAKEINDRICNLVSYSFCANEDGSLTADAPYIRTAYGALVNNKAVCEGYSRLYKAALNKLGIECEIINGYFMKDNNAQPHMWNYVQDENGDWFGVDVTMNDGYGATGEDYSAADYFWATKETMYLDHIESKTVSSVQYEMPYPRIKKLWDSDVNSGLFNFNIEKINGVNVLSVTYDGLDAETLASERGLYMAFRMVSTSTGAVKYGSWTSAIEMKKAIYSGFVYSKNGKTYCKNFGITNTAVYEIEVGIFDIPDDEVKNEKLKMCGYSQYAETHDLLESESVKNPDHNPDHVTPAYVKSTEPANLLTYQQDICQTQEISVTYDEDLRLTSGTKPVIEWWVSSVYKRDLTDEVVRKYAYLDEDSITFDGKSTISFKFTPSQQYNHNSLSYHFRITNMVNVLDNGKDGVAVKDFAVLYSYFDAYLCNQYFGDGRLKMNIYAQPSLVDNNDLSLEGWKFEDGTPVSSNQRSQLALVITKPADDKKLTELAEDAVGAKDYILTSQTFEIDLNICGKYPIIPNGSDMRLCLGFPDGITPDMEGISFKLYHFKRLGEGLDTLDYENVEQIDCIVTEYGLIATIKSFSPYVLVAVRSDAIDDETKGITTDFNGKGGTVTASTGSSTSILNSGESITYTFTPDEGYEVEYVMLNGEVLESVGNSLTLTYDELNKNNTLSVGFVAETVKSAEEEEGAVNLITEFVSATAFIEPQSEHVHYMKEAKADDMVCTTAGSDGCYWHCVLCEKDYADADGVREIRLTEHNPVNVAQVPPTMGVNGVKAHIECSLCHKLFDDNMNVITMESLLIDALPITGWVEDTYLVEDVPVTGLQLIDGYYYDFGSDGVCSDRAKYTGIVETSDGLCYAVEGKKYPAGLVEIDGEYYYAMTSGVLAVNTTVWVTDKNGLTKGGNGYYSFDSNGKMIKTGFVDAPDGFTYYYDDTARAKGFTKIGEDYYILNAGSGKMYKDATMYVGANSYGIKTGYYYFDENGKMFVPDPVNGKKAVVNENGKLYFTIDGVKMTNGLNELDGEYYYAPTSAQLVTDSVVWVSFRNNLIEESNGYFGFDAGGKMIKTGFINAPDGFTYYYKDTVRAKGFTKIGDDYYLFNAGSGKMYKDATMYVGANDYGIKTGFYYFDAAGKMYVPDLENGNKKIVSENGKLYFTIDGVKMTNGLNELGGEYYYATSSGALAVDTVIWVSYRNDLIDESNGYFAFDAQGKMIKTGFVNAPDGYTYYYNNLVRAKGLTKIGEDYYFFNAGSGKMYKDVTLWVAGGNAYGFASGMYYFGADGKMAE